MSCASEIRYLPVSVDTPLIIDMGQHEILAFQFTTSTDLGQIAWVFEVSVSLDKVHWVKSNGLLTIIDKTDISSGQQEENSSIQCLAGDKTIAGTIFAGGFRYVKLAAISPYVPNIQVPLYIGYSRDTQYRINYNAIPHPLPIVPISLTNSINNHGIASVPLRVNAIFVSNYSLSDLYLKLFPYTATIGVTPPILTLKCPAGQFSKFDFGNNLRVESLRIATTLNAADIDTTAIASAGAKLLINVDILS